MSKALIITEKPSVARDIVAALGGFQRCDGGAYWESADYLVSFAVGHLLQLLAPDEYDPAWKAWDLKTLPMIPQRFRLKPDHKHKERLGVLQALATRDDVDTVINACDAAREGELIFQELKAYLRFRQPVERVWLQSMTPQAIRQALAERRPASQYAGLAAAARCRAYSDWLIGMNASRAFSLRLRPLASDGRPWSVGRVQTPTLALLVDRELERLGHVPESYWRVQAQFKTENSNHNQCYSAYWYDPLIRRNFEKNQYPDRIADLQTAKKLVEKVAGQAGVASEERKRQARQAPLLFSLTALQKHMSLYERWDSSRTLQAAQRCYEQHKVITYPRTSSQCLPESDREHMRQVLRDLQALPDWQNTAQSLLQQGWANDERLFDDEGVGDHFAIIPTGVTKQLTGDDLILWQTVLRRFFAAMSPPAVYEVVTRLTIVAGESFKSGPREMLTDPGWRAYEPELAWRQRKQTATAGREDDGGVWPPLTSPDVMVQTAKPMEAKTQAPPAISEARLLTLMEHAGRQVDDRERALALMNAKGLGTAATRADIISGLKQRGYVSDQLQPTPKGLALIASLGLWQVEQLTSASMTADLEWSLGQIEQGLLSEEDYLKTVHGYVHDLARRTQQIDLASALASAPSPGPCPTCQQAVKMQARGYRCSDGSCQGLQLPIAIAGRYLDHVTVERLLASPAGIKVTGFFDEASKPFAGTLSLTSEQPDGWLLQPESPTTRWEPVATQPGAASSASQAGTPAAKVIAPCPIHGPACEVIETAKAFICTERLNAWRAGDAHPVGVMIPKVLCKQKLNKKTVRAILAEGCSEELAGFVSRQGRNFSARLLLTPGGQVSFQFPKDAST